MNEEIFNPLDKRNLAKSIANAIFSQPAVPLGESLLIEIARPLWNYVLDGFGNHDPGKGRYSQQKSPWDVLHPGREWAKRLQEGKTLVDVQKAVKRFFEEVV